ncbi:uncharacterized protein PFL1_01669 [Pseudozyma flocculosa PF-1]|uniref:Uncharacterized protein n=1 Tax=Pseudozyma flocculosa TaxID=84751 RepID=A0A5C3EX74_9BASI|nr:uncharacterized protein PFL1_01669 [Pseudozyma flocculosa PF-1]EPQ30768.1 hypothetical protein PFL1_01669 [Pseudozyma flocculosa PF-1]SPO36873.1 uncharacterized protein PSFLO_02344 [Pseudozyma flocculosa]
MSIGSSPPAATDMPNATGDEPTTALHLLRSFKECQERRVAHWHEYNDAFSTYLSQPPPPVTTATAGQAASTSAASSDAANLTSPSSADQQRAARTPHSCSHAAAAHDAEGAQSGGRIAISDDMLQEILHLVTQGLLECSHRARAIQTELALPHIDKPQLAALVGRIQAKENDLLRATVERDQLRKVALSQQRDFNDKIASLDARIASFRDDIAQEMQEVAAEMAEL